MEPSVFYGGETTLGGIEVNEFWLRDSWVHFYLQRSAFDGMRPGLPIESIHGRAASNAAWVWPHEIVWFFRDVASTDLLQVLGATREAPRLIEQLWQRLANAGITQDGARLFINRDALAWRTMFGAIGTDHQVQRLRPDLAYWARVLGGVAGVEEETAIAIKPEKPAELIDQLVSLVAVGAGIIGVASAIAGALINAIIIAAGALTAVAPWAVKAITIGSIVLIVLVAVAWAVVVILTIIGMIVLGIILISTAWSADLTVAAES